MPRRLLNPKRKTIGIRVPDHPIVQTLLDELGEPLMSTTLILPGKELPETDTHEMRDRLEHDVDLVIDGGHCGFEPTTVIDMTGEVPRITRKGRGAAEGLAEG